MLKILTASTDVLKAYIYFLRTFIAHAFFKETRMSAFRKWMFGPSARKICKYQSGLPQPLAAGLVSAKHASTALREKITSMVYIPPDRKLGIFIFC